MDKKLFLHTLTERGKDVGVASSREDSQLFNERSADPFETKRTISYNDLG
jgi:hypothetical protein